MKALFPEKAVFRTARQYRPSKSSQLPKGMAATSGFVRQAPEAY
jgi:hypothetical protein